MKIYLCYVTIVIVRQILLSFILKVIWTKTKCLMERNIAQKTYSKVHSLKHSYLNSTCYICIIPEVKVGSKISQVYLVYPKPVEPKWPR